EKQILVGRMVQCAELPHGPYGANFHARLEVVVQPVRDLPARYTLDRDRDQVRTGRRRRYGVTAIDDFAVNLEVEGEKLTGQVVKVLWLLGSEQKRLDVMCLLQHTATNQYIVDFSVPGAVIPIEVRRQQPFGLHVGDCGLIKRCRLGQNQSP